MVFLLVTAGTVRGFDDDFPFGPFKMYATRDDPNGSVFQVLVEAVTSSGRLVDVTNTSGAPRRAELEGRLGSFAADPAEFADVAARYVHGVAPNSVAGTVTQIRLIDRRFPLHDGRSGTPIDAVVATWNVP